MLIYSTNNFFLSHKQFTSSETKTRQKSILSLPQFKINAKVTVSKYYSKDLGSNRFGNWKFKTGPCLFVLSVCSLGWIVIWKQLILCKFFFFKESQRNSKPKLAPENWPKTKDQRDVHYSLLRVIPHKLIASYSTWHTNCFLTLMRNSCMVLWWGYIVYPQKFNIWWYYWDIINNFIMRSQTLLMN